MLKNKGAERYFRLIAAMFTLKGPAEPDILYQEQRIECERYENDEIFDDPPSAQKRKGYENREHRERVARYAQPERGRCHKNQGREGV